MRQAAKIASLREQDQAARLLAQSEFRRPLVLEAGAGTGKTTTLVARVLAWCLGPGWRLAAQAREGEQAHTLPTQSLQTSDESAVAAAVLRGVVAITFTEAAAAEMAERIGEGFAAVGGGEAPQWLALEALPGEETLSSRARALTGALDHLSVRTIHSFCRSLLADHPLEAGLHPELVVDADGYHADQAVQEAVEAALRGAEAGSLKGLVDPLMALAGQGMGPAKVAESLAALLQEGVLPETLEEDPLSGERIAAFRQRLMKTLARFVEVARPLDGVDGRSKTALAVMDAADASIALLEKGRDPSIKDLGQVAAAVSELWTESHLRKLGDWAKGTFGKGEAKVLGENAVAVEPATSALGPLLRHLSRLDPVLLDTARRVLGALLREVKENLRRRGVLTFSDLLVEAGRLLTTRDSVRRAVQQGIDQLLVDEFQDTDPVQCALVRALALEGRPEERPGLFLVGDPKQSIYGWRRADLAAYDDFVQEVEAAGGARHVLVENFRSVPAILEEVQRVVEPVMRQKHGHQPSFQPLLPCDRLAGERGFAAGGARPLERWISWHPAARHRKRQETLAHEAVTVEAAALARDLRRLHDEEGVPWKSFALLLRSVGQLDVYLDALREAGIPFAVGRTKQYYRRREIIEAAALVRAVLDPGDQLALVTLLRSPMVGVPDAALLPLWSRGLPQLLTDPDPERIRAVSEEVATGLPDSIPGLEGLAGWPVALTVAAENLSHLRRAYREEPAAVFVDGLRTLFLQEVLESARYLGRYRLANLQRFFRQLLEALEEGRDLTATLRLLRRSISGGEDAEEGQPGAEGREAVQILTIHGSKGLGFEHVYFLQMHKQDQRGSTQDTAVGTVSLGKPASGRTSHQTEYKLLGLPSLGNDLLEEARRTVAEAEQVRLLYVAMTRAKQRLVLGGSWSRRVEPSAAASKNPEKADTLLKLVESTTPVPPVFLMEEGEAPESADPKSADPETAIESQILTGDGVRWFLAGTALPDASDTEKEFASEAELESQNPLASRQAIVEEARELRRLRQEAAVRRSRPWRSSPSARAHEALEESDEQESGTQASRPVPADPKAERQREIALAIGTAVHRALEIFDLEADPTEELERQIEGLAEALPAGLTGEDRVAAQAGATEILESLEGSELLARFVALGSHVLARELPVLLPAPEVPSLDEEEAPEASLARVPLGYVSGILDLLYRDPESGAIVVADFKTDAVDSDQDLEHRARAYALQGALYSRAVQEALNLSEPPRFELWFLRPGRVVLAPPR